METNAIRLSVVTMQAGSGWMCAKCGQRINTGAWSVLVRAWTGDSPGESRAFHDRCAAEVLLEQAR